MKSVIVVASVGVVLTSLSSAVAAACAAPSLRLNTRAALIAALEGKIVCVPPVTQPNMQWQEFHQQGGALIDYKRGPNDKVDPSEQVGTWSLSGVDGRSVVITHDYGGGNRYTYSVWDNRDGTHSFCSANPEIKARIQPNSGPC